MSSANDLTQRTILAVQTEFPKSRLFRANVGLAYPVTSFRRAWSFLSKGIMPDWFRPVSYGTAGQGDLGGWLHINGVAICLHVEIKAGADTQREAQKAFEETLTRHGGIYLICRDVDQCLADLRKIVATKSTTGAI